MRGILYLFDNIPIYCDLYFWKLMVCDKKISLEFRSTLLIYQHFLKYLVDKPDEFLDKEDFLVDILFAFLQKREFSLCEELFCSWSYFPKILPNFYQICLHISKQLDVNDRNLIQLVDHLASKSDQGICN